MKFLYLHGSNSAGYGTKVNVLRKYFGDDCVINPNLPPNPEKAISLLEFMVEKMKGDDFYLVGSSLGGFFSLYLANKYEVPAILINPLIHPKEVLVEEDTPAENFKTGEKYIHKKDWSKFMLKIEQSKSSIQHLKSKIFVFKDKEDELLDYKEALEFFEGFYVKIFPGGNHIFEHMEELGKELKENLLKTNQLNI